MLPTLDQYTERHFKRWHTNPSQPDELCTNWLKTVYDRLMLHHNSEWDKWGYRTRCINGTHWTEFSKQPKKGEQLLLWREPSERWMSTMCDETTLA